MARNWAITKDRFLSQAEVAKLYAALRDARDLAIQRGTFFCHIRDYYLIRLLLETGLRVFECVALQIGDFKAGALVVRKGKGNKPRTILLTKGTQKLLAEFLRIKTKVLREPIGTENFLFLSERGRPYSTRGIRKRVKLWFGTCGFARNLSTHSCRHSYASHLIASTGDLVLARDNLGHSSLAVTSIYTHSTREDLGELMLYEAKSSEKTGKRN